VSRRSRSRAARIAFRPRQGRRVWPGTLCADRYLVRPAPPGRGWHRRGAAPAFPESRV